MKQIESTQSYFDREGFPMSLEDWATRFQDHDYKIVKQERSGKYLVSTVWVGINMCFRPDLPIQIFETIVFSIEDEKHDNPDQLVRGDSTEEEALVGHERVWLGGNVIDGYMQRYSTEQEALRGHEETVKLAAQGLL
jgi:hypothetical protein